MVFNYEFFIILKKLILKYINFNELFFKINFMWFFGIKYLSNNLTQTVEISLNSLQLPKSTIL